MALPSIQIMNWYKCFLVGENFPGEWMDRKNELIGFYVTRFVAAISTEEAETIGLSSLQKEVSLKLPSGVTPSSKAKIYFEEVTVVSKEEVPEIQPGFTFYVMGT